MAAETAVFPGIAQKSTYEGKFTDRSPYLRSVSIFYTVWNRYVTYNFFVCDEWCNKFISLIAPPLDNNSC